MVCRISSIEQTVRVRYPDPHRLSSIRAATAHDQSEAGCPAEPIPIIQGLNGFGMGWAQRYYHSELMPTHLDCGTPCDSTAEL